jgi:saccharopine dehydrogenase-like NADP-dependent oxidoreductase
MLGKYEKFPLTIHFLKKFSSTANIKQLQQSLVQTLKEINRKTCYFEEISIPTIPNSEIIFEFGIAEEENFNFLDEQETSRVLNMLEGKSPLDFFCVARYYKYNAEKKTALKFDYYMFRTNFAAKEIEFQVFHKQGPRYIAPEDLVIMIIDKINNTSNKKILH